MNNTNPLYYLEERSFLNKLTVGFGKDNTARQFIAGFRKGVDKTQKTLAKGVDKATSSGFVKKAGEVTGKAKKNIKNKIKSIKDKRDAKKKASQALIQKKKNAHEAVKLGVLTKASTN